MTIPSPHNLKHVATALLAPALMAATPVLAQHEPPLSVARSVIEAFVAAADRRDVSTLEGLLDPHYRVVFNQTAGTPPTVLEREQYLQMLREGKLGGKPRKLTVAAIVGAEGFAAVVAQSQHDSARFHGVYSLVQRGPRWWLLQETVLMTPLEATPGQPVAKSTPDAAAPRAPAMPDPEMAATVAATLAQLESAWNAADGPAFAEPFADDASFVTIRGELHHGKPAIAHGHEAIFASIYKGSRMRYETLAMRRLGADTVSVQVMGTLDAPVGPLAGINCSVATLLLTRTGPRWRIEAFHNTLNAPQGSQAMQGS